MRDDRDGEDMQKGRLARPFFIYAVLAEALAPSMAVAQPIALEIAAAEVGFDRRTTEPVVAVRLTEASRKRFASLTQENVGRAMAVIVDGRTVMKAVIREPIIGGRLQILSNLTEVEVRALAKRLASGKAKFEVEFLN